MPTAARARPDEIKSRTESSRPGFLDLVDHHPGRARKRLDLLTEDVAIADQAEELAVTGTAHAGPMGAVAVHEV
jgi:hypothetical protein